MDVDWQVAPHRLMGISLSADGPFLVRQPLYLTPRTTPLRQAPRGRTPCRVFPSGLPGIHPGRARAPPGRPGGKGDRSWNDTSSLTQVGI